MNIVLQIYLAGVVAIALRLSWHVLFRLDRFDWRAARSKIWCMLILVPFLWPLFLFIPELLANPSPLFQPEGFALQIRDRDRALSQAARCGPVIRFRPSASSDVHGEFLLSAAALEQAVHDLLRTAPHLANSDEGALVKWLRHRDEAIKEPVDIPAAWTRVEHYILRLVSSGSARVCCLKCGHDIPPDHLVEGGPERGPWIVDRLACPAGHALLASPRIHISR